MLTRLVTLQIKIGGKDKTIVGKATVFAPPVKRVISLEFTTAAGHLLAQLINGPNPPPPPPMGNCTYYSTMGTLVPATDKVSRVPFERGGGNASPHASRTHTTQPTPRRIPQCDIISRSRAARPSLQSMSSSIRHGLPPRRG